MPPNATPKPKRRIGLLVGIGIGVFITFGGVGTVAYAAMQGWITLPYHFLAPKPPTTQDIAKAIMDISSASITIDFEEYSQPKQPDTIVIPRIPKVKTSSTTEGDSEDIGIIGIALTDSSLTDRYKAIFADAKIGGTIKMSISKGEQTDSQGSTKLTYQNSGISLVFDSEYLYTDKDFFLKLNAFPLPFYNFSALTEKWIRIPEKNITSPLAIMDSENEETPTTIWEYEETTSTRELLNFQQEQKKKTEEAAEKVQREVNALRDALLENQAFVIRSSKLTKNDAGQRIWRLTLVLDPDRVIEAIATATQERPETESFKKMLETESFKAQVRAVISAITSEMDIDPKTSAPIRQTFHLQYATENSQNLPTPKETVIDITYQLDHVNQAVTIPRPTETIDIQEAVKLIAGITEQDPAETALQNQAEIVDEIRTALSAYKNTHKQYPDALEQLIGQREGRYLLRKVVRMMNDQFTNQPFVYAPSSDKQDYSLIYEIRFPKIETGEGAEDSLWAGSFVEGKNTANKTVESLEVEQTNDSDQDGLTDAEERIHGTNRRVADTDHDGFTDKQEIDDGFDPLTNSKTNKKYAPPY